MMATSESRSSLEKTYVQKEESRGIEQERVARPLAIPPTNAREREREREELEVPRHFETGQDESSFFYFSELS